MKELYLDANAHVPMSKAVQKVYTDFQSSRGGYGNPSAPNAPGRDAANALETARGRIANLLGARSSGNIVFTSTCTQACEWGMKLIPNEEVYHSPIEHPAVDQAINLLKNKIGIENTRKLDVTPDGVIKNVPKNKVIICTHVQNEIGTIQPIFDIDAKFLFTDMCQSPGKVSLCLRENPVDIAVFGGHKFGGSAGVGILYLKDGSLWKEFGTGSRYFHDRPGTPDVAAIVATAAALEETLMHMPERLSNMREFQKTLEDRLIDSGIEVLGHSANRVPNTTFFKVPKKALFLLTDLSNEGIYVGMGSACGSLHTGPSLLLNAIGQDSDGEDVVRISQHGEYNSEDAIYVFDKIKKMLKQIKI